MDDNNADVENIPSPTTMASGTIKPIGKESIHKICSGQVVLSLAIAVKELVENSLDAGATLIEVKIRDHGLESVEVSDNGNGVDDHNLEGMTAKYHTSKIREFDDLQGVETFGFRGEALSSLCALSSMIIQTRHKSTDIGTRLELDDEGKVQSRMPCARSVGTTVTLTNLFKNLPVRRRDFSRNVKKEFAKMCQILQAYCLVSKGVRIICSNHSSKGNKTVVLQTHGANDVLANISAIFGNHQIVDIIPIKSPFEKGKVDEDDIRQKLASDAGDTTQISSDDVERLNAANFEIEGFISSCTHGAGRSSKDRQFFYVNSRPCDLKNISKTINEIYHRYNVNQYPFVYLNILTSRADVDVNLTPDKRQLLLNNEKILLLALKKALVDTFGSSPSVYKIQNSVIATMNTITGDQNNFSNDSNENEQLKSSKDRFLDVLTQWKRTGDTKGGFKSTKRKCDDVASTLTLKLPKIDGFLTQNILPKVVEFTSDSEIDGDTSFENGHSSSENRSALDLNVIKKQSEEYDRLAQQTDEPKVTEQRIDCTIFSAFKKRNKFFENLPSSQTSTNSADTVETNDQSAFDDFEEVKESGISENSSQKEVFELDNSDAEVEQNIYTCGALCTSISEIAQKLQAEDEHITSRNHHKRIDRLRFKTEINPTQNKIAEAELQKELTKESFAHMEILGQFNLGFILTKSDNDIFIIDQHATDEKYNFETLQRTTRLQHQKLAIPQPLELTAVNEMILLEHLELFEQNGFKFEIDANAPATKKIRLTGKPISKNWEFGQDDIDEMIFMLQDAPEGTICRPTRIRAMFASRACRQSVMIGTPLKRSLMKALIKHMGEIEQPWNCPHGRPTMRHLINIAMLEDNQS